MDLEKTYRMVALFVSLVAVSVLVFSIWLWDIRLFLISVIIDFWRHRRESEEN